MRAGANRDRIRCFKCREYDHFAKDCLNSDTEKDIDDEEVNSYHNIIINNIDRENIIISQMEQLSILSNVVNHVQYNRHPKDFYDLDIKALDQKNHGKIYDRLKEEDREVLELDFGDNPDKSKGEY